MSGVGMKIDVTGQALAVPDRVRKVFAPAALNPLVGRAAVNVTRKHLFDRNTSNPNALGGNRTNYYAGAARGTSYVVVEGGVLISINQVGIRQRFYGGTIKAKKAKFLTIAVAPEAYGKTAREFANLVVVYAEGGRPVALATASTRSVQFTQNARGKLVKKAIGRMGTILFLLKKSVTQRPDPSVLPTPDVIYGAVQIAINDTVARAIARGAASTQ